MAGAVTGRFRLGGLDPVQPLQALRQIFGSWRITGNSEPGNLLVWVRLGAHILITLRYDPRHDCNPSKSPPITGEGVFIFLG